MTNLISIISQLSAIENLQENFESNPDQIFYWYKQLSEVSNLLN